jgi:hypothetical protein
MDVDLEAQLALPAASVFVDWSQQSTNMCSSMAFMNAWSLITALNHPRASVSATFAYYNQRIEECSIPGAAAVCKCPDGSCAPPCLDCGSYLNAAAATYTTGVAPRSAAPLQNTLALMNLPPSAAADAAAKSWRIGGTVCIPLAADGAPANVAAVKAFLHVRAPVVVFLNLDPAQDRWMSAQVYSSAPPDAVASVVMPAHASPSSQGDVGHVVCLVGAVGDLLYFRNSFGLSWGAGGRFALPVAAFAYPQVHAATAVFNTVLPPEVEATLGSP